ncbi:hypothetical protein ES703_52631 [subsurface metagenome]
MFRPKNLKIYLQRLFIVLQGKPVFTKLTVDRTYITVACRYIGMIRPESFQIDPQSLPVILKCQLVCTQIMVNHAEASVSRG